MIKKNQKKSNNDIKGIINTIMNNKIQLFTYNQEYSNLGELKSILEKRNELTNTISYDQDSNVLDIRLYANIGPGPHNYDETDLTNDMKVANDQTSINLYINSHGGVLHSGIAMMNILARHKGIVTATIDGIAASAASIAAYGADVIQAYSSASMLIHQARGITAGTADDKEAAAAMMKKIDNEIADIYHQRSGIDKNKILNIMKEDTILTAQEALDLKLIDKIINQTDEEQVSNSINIEYITNYIEVMKLLGYYTE